MQDRLPQRARDLDDARIGQELGEIAAHRRRRRRVGRAEVDEQDADPRAAASCSSGGSARRVAHAAGSAAFTPLRERPRRLRADRALDRRQPSDQGALRAERLAQPA